MALAAINEESIGNLNGTHTGSSGASVLTDSGAQFVTDGIEIGLVIQNVTDGSTGTVTAVTETTITAPLSGGTDNDWDTSDVWKFNDRADLVAWTAARPATLTQVEKGILVNDIEVSASQNVSGKTTSFFFFFHFKGGRFLDSDGLGGRKITYSSNVGTGLSMNLDFGIIEDIRVDGLTGAANPTDEGIRMDGIGVTLRRFVVEGVNNSTGSMEGVLINSGNGSQVNNGIVRKMATTGGGSGSVVGVAMQGSVTCRVQSINVYDIDIASGSGNCVGVNFSNDTQHYLSMIIVGKVTNGGSGVAKDFVLDAPSNPRLTFLISEASTAGTGQATGDNALTGKSPTDVWTDPANGDFTLKAGSPAIGHGRVEGIWRGWHLDASGKSRQFDPSWDAGALQKAAEVATPATAYIDPDSFFSDSEDSPADNTFLLDFIASIKGTGRIQVAKIIVESSDADGDGAVSTCKIGATDFTLLKRFSDTGSGSGVEYWGLDEANIPSGEQTITVVWVGPTVNARHQIHTFTIINTDESLTPQASATGSDFDGGPVALTLTPTSADAFILAGAAWESGLIKHWNDEDEGMVIAFTERVAGNLSGSSSWFSPAPASARTMNLFSSSATSDVYAVAIALGSAAAATLVSPLVNKSLIQSTKMRKLVT